MWESIKKTIVIALATLGVLFIVIMLIPDDEEPAETAQSEEISEEADADEKSEEEAEEDEAEAEEETEDAEAVKEDAKEEETAKDEGNIAKVDIPSSEISDQKLEFTTVTLDGEKIDQDIFSDYDITVVHVWGTFCQPCIAEMGDYAKLYKKLPDNVNLIAIVCDVYEGIDTNVSEANDILGNAKAKFLNLRTSDDLYDVVGYFQYVPSSFFVDKEGRVIGSMMDGASFSDTKERLESYLK